MDINHISILLLEDEIDDVDLLKMALDKAPFNYQIDHAIDKSSFQSFLENKHHDIIISDHNLPQFSGLDALQIARDIHENIPFILVSGFVGEDEAVNMIVENGVNDFILKDKLGRLNHSILREIKSYKVKCELEEKNKELRELSIIARQAHNGVIITDADGSVEWVNASTIDLTGYSLKEFVGKKPSDLLHGPDTSLETKKRIREKLEKRERVQEIIENYRKDGSKYWIKLDISPIFDEQGDFLKFVAIQEDVTEKKSAELKLKENQERLSAITDNIEALVYRYVQYPDGSDKITYINKHVESIYELEQEQVIKDTSLVWNQILEEDLEGLISSINKSSEELSTWSQEFRIVTPSGKKKWLRGIGIPTKESDHTYWNTVVTDITHEKEFEKTIQESNERFLAAQEIAQFGDWSVDLVSGDTYHSPIIKRIYEVEGEGEWELQEGIKFYKEGYSRNKIKQVLKEAIENGTPYEEDVVIVSAKGNERWVRAKCRPTFADGKCVRLNGTLMDITKQKVLELQLIEQKERYQVAIQGADLGIWDANIRDETNVANDRWYEMFGFKAEEIEESFSFFFSRVHPDDVDTITNAIEKIRKGEKDSFEEIIRVQHKNGDYITILDKGTGLERDPDGKVTRIIGTHLDITKQKELQDRIKKSLDEKTVLLGEIHHRVKNNLAIISGLMQLQEFESDKEEVSEIVHDMTQRIRSIASVHELLYENDNFSNISLHKYINTLCKNVEASFIKQTDIVIEISIDDSVLININQAVPIGLLMNELITNSFKYAFSEVDQPKIKFMMIYNDGKYHAEYFDNGPGADMANLEETSSLGTTLIFTLLDQLEADYEFDNENGFLLNFNFHPQVSGSQANMYHN